MELDRKALDRLLAMDDSALGALTSKIAEAAGADHAKAAQLLGNLDLVRNALARMTPREAEALIRSAGKEKSNEILSIINKKES